ncbi:hypothetical protein V5O48_019028 [Marasmius crinis-equi]|uniref:Uncharacterized protein n=1 Tax=Marasmius crinis-equi TaxID=585013 RepID=A0ABR3EJM8_9AGAR
MIRQIKLAKPGTGKYIILNMQPPLREQKKKDLPWNNESNQTSSSVQDQQESDSEDDIGPMAKKAKLDDDRKDIANRIHDYYLQEEQRCTIHPDNPCFFHAPTKLHFNLEKRPPRLQWGAMIRSGKLDYTRIPFGSGYFMAAHADKRHAPSVASALSTAAAAMSTSPTMPTIPPPVPATPQGSAFRSYGPGYGYPPTPWLPSGYQTPQKRHARHETEQILSSPASDAGLDQPYPTVKEFCATYKLDDDIHQCLTNLKWRVSYDPNCIMEASWEKAGFTQITWEEVLWAYKRFSKSHQA